jgi:hypothetical protein
MATTRAAKPVTKPVDRTRVSSRAKKPAAKTAAAKKSAPKKTTGKIPAKPKSAKQAYKKQSAKVRASVKKRKATIAANLQRHVDRTTRVDACDEVGSALVDKANAPWELAAERVPTGDVAEPLPSAWVKRSATERVDDPPPATGIALVERVTRAVERELSQIEVIVGGHHVKPGQRTEAERRARTLASLARTLTEVRKLRADEHRVKPQDDPDRPRDIEELRRRLAERLAQFVRGTTDPPAGNNEAGGDRLRK